MYTYGIWDILTLPAWRQPTHLPEFLMMLLWDKLPGPSLSQTANTVLGISGTSLGSLLLRLEHMQKGLNSKTKWCQKSLSKDKSKCSYFLHMKTWFYIKKFNLAKNSICIRLLGNMAKGAQTKGRSTLSGGKTSKSPIPPSLVFYYNIEPLGRNSVDISTRAITRWPGEGTECSQLHSFLPSTC